MWRMRRKEQLEEWWQEVEIKGVGKEGMGWWMKGRNKWPKGMLAQYLRISLIWPHFGTCTVFVSQRKQLHSLPIAFIHISYHCSTPCYFLPLKQPSPHPFLSFIPLIMLLPYLLSITFFSHSFLCPPHHHSTTLSFILLTLKQLRSYDN